MVVERNNFSLEGYRTLVQNFLDKGYRTVTFEEVKKDQKHLILRHDIDMSLEYAIAIAEIEYHMGVESIFFVLLRTDLYNLFSEENCKKLEILKKLNRKIGLHFDASLYEQNWLSLEAAAKNECELLQFMMGEPIQHISFHRPAPILIGIEKPFADRINTYEKRFYEEIGYCSDSEGRWRFQHPLEHEAVLRNEALQLLTHPIWWVSKGKTEIEKLQKFIKRSFENFENTLANNCKPYALHLAQNSDHVA